MAKTTERKRSSYDVFKSAALAAILAPDINAGDNVSGSAHKVRSSQPRTMATDY